MATDKRFANFLTYIKIVNEPTNLKEIFNGNSSLKSMFKFIWLLPESKTFFKLPIPKANIYHKNQLDSEKFRQLGNELYKSNKLDKALEAYNYSIMTAPLPDEELPDCLPLAYANRSAALYGMGVYSSAIDDIDRAFAHGYPNSKSPKLLERKAKCFLRLKQLDKKLSEHIGNEKLLEHVKCSLPNSYDTFFTGHNSVEVGKYSDPNSSSYDTVFFTGPENFVGEVVQDAVKVEYSTEKGRHLVASRDILPGQILLSEKALCSVVTLDSQQRSYCATCTRRAPVILPCPSCSLVVFCSEECRTEAISPDGFHIKECQTLPYLVTLRSDFHVALAFRILCSHTFTQIRNEIIEEEAENTTETKKSSEPFVNFGYNYRTLHHLEGNIESRNMESLMEAGYNAVILTKLLLRADFMDSDSLDDIVFIGAEIMNLIMKIQCNMHCLRELQIIPSTPINACPTGIVGYGVFSFMSLVNHSCIPNTLNSRMNNKKILYSISSISAGTEICDTYGERYVSHCKKSRLKSLLENYYFLCKCAACVQNIPVFSSLPDNPVCSMCKQRIKGCECNKKMKSRRKNKEPMELMEYNRSYKCLNKREVDERLVINLAKYVSFLEKCTVIPSKPYVEAQESLMRAFDLMGSQRMVLPEVNLP